MSTRRRGKTENFKRPNHNDFKDSAELKKEKFSGVRHNNLSREWEIWTLGDLRAHGPEADRRGFETAYQEVFACEEVKVST